MFIYNLLSMFCFLNNTPIVFCFNLAATKKKIPKQTCKSRKYYMWQAYGYIIISIINIIVIKWQLLFLLIFWAF